MKIGRAAFFKNALESRMSATFGGPGSAFAFGSFTTTTASARAPRRTTSSGKEERTSPIGVPAAQNGGPQPAEGQSNPSLGSWANPHEHAREGDANSHPDGQQRSFSSILSPAHPADAHEDSLDPAKPFVYSREFLLSLYDDDKRNRRPLELARHDIATTDSGAQPWALTEYRDGEKEVSLFSSSIAALLPHPAALDIVHAIYRQIDSPDRSSLVELFLFSIFLHPH